jgi:hypothetical protein
MVLAELGSRLTTALRKARSFALHFARACAAAAKLVLPRRYRAAR